MIRFENVNAGYDDRTVLRDVNLLIAPGTFHFLTGPSGSGKSTFLRLLSLDLKPSRGKLSLFDRSDVSEVSVAEAAQLRRRMGIVLQDNPMLKHLSVWSNVAVPLFVLGKKKSDFQDDVTDLLQWVGLGDVMNAPPDTLSGGERQRACIARAAIGKPELFLADEPTASIDPQMARRLLRMFIELNRLGVTVIIGTHDHQLIRQFKAPRMEIHDGSIRIV